MITIVHGGQTGVDRGAHYGALLSDLPISGYLPLDRRDETGRAPRSVDRALTPWPSPGYAARTIANVRESTALLVLVDGRVSSPGTRLTIDFGRRYLKGRWRVLGNVGRMVENARDVVGDWLVEIRAPVRLMVAGPRASLWPGGQRMAERVVVEIARLV